MTGDIGSGNLQINGELPSHDHGVRHPQDAAEQLRVRVADATTGTLKTAYDGAAPDVFAGAGEWQIAGGIGLGVTSDNSNTASGAFLEGAITSSRPTNAAVHENVKALGYGQ